MSSPIIQVENLCKDYVISHQGGTENYQTLRDTVSSWFKKSKIKNHASSRGLEIFHALKDVSFEVQQGEVLGIIGRNGAGKSTLLKILSRITEPTHGKVRLRGRVASLLEVGTGFHGELTGRENIFLNGAILGMTRAEIKKKFDEIVDFSGVEKFLDTPVKRYSSGMYVRLAFAVAAHLEPEILIVDEVLAVGDQEFQKKCLGKMKDVSASEGRTVLFVSHNLAAVRQLCGRAVLLSQGCIEKQGVVSEVLSQYSQQSQSASNHPATYAIKSQPAHVTRAVLERIDNRPTLSLRVGEPWQVRLNIQIDQPLSAFVASIGLVNHADIPVQTSWSTPQEFDCGTYEFIFTQEHVFLAADTYRVLLGLSNNGRTLEQKEYFTLEIIPDLPIISCMATSGCGLILNPMTPTFRRIQ